jgi:hypothetical protein
MCFCHITVFIIYPGSFAQTSGVLTLLQRGGQSLYCQSKWIPLVFVSFTFNLVHSLPWSFNFNLMYYTSGLHYLNYMVSRAQGSYQRLFHKRTDLSTRGDRSTCAREPSKPWYGFYRILVGGLMPYQRKTLFFNVMCSMYFVVNCYAS